MRVGQNIIALLATAARATAAPLDSRDVIDHDAVVGFNQTVPSGAIGDAYLKFKPWLKVVNGCVVPFPAVDAAGNTNGGLANTGSPSGDCDSSPGQIYARGAQNGSHFALMYSWYWPKDEPSPGIGHRHDWEAVVVWIDDPNLATPTIQALATSAHGDFDVITSNFPLDGTRPKIQYASVFPLDHSLGTTSTIGGEQPLIAWESLPAAASAALTNTDFGAANVPFKDANFENNLIKASF